jgi:large subunit ribosomal protein L25
VNVETEGETALLSDIADIRRDPVADKFLHVYFHEVSQIEKMATLVPLEFFGESIGVKNSGEIFDMVRHEASVRCLPADLLSSIRVDISGFDVGNVIHISDLGIPNGVEII